MAGTKAETPRRGLALIAALLLLVVFTSLGVAMASFTDLSLRKSDNCRAVAGSRLAAESGLEFMLQQLAAIRLPGTTSEETFAINCQVALAQRLNGTDNLAGQSVTSAADVVYVPEIRLDQGSFTTELTWIAANRCLMTVRGRYMGVSRSISMEMELVPRQPRVFDYGLASKGKISISGNARIIGVNYPEEASIISATRDNIEAIHVDGNAEISGDISVCDDHNTIVITGTPSIGGSSDPAVWAEHMHFGLDEPDFPELDTSELEALATNVVDVSTDTSQGVFNNIRILAGTNPIFSSDVVINGVVFVEAPNVVTFTAKTTLNGLVVTEDNGFDPETCQLFFGGHVDAHGVEALPDTPEFADVKRQTGTFILAPGFAVTFAGSFSAINGTIAADQLTFTGTAEGVIRGSVIGLEDRIIKVGGNVDIYVDRQNADQSPAGFVNSFAFQPLPNTYSESPEG